MVPASSLVRTPAHLSDAEAAALPAAATTAWGAVRSAALGPQKTALVLGTGGVSLFALQFAKAHGARVIVTSSSDEKLERARVLGSDEVITYHSTPQWANEVLRLTQGSGADLVLETGGTTTFPQSTEAAALDGTVLSSAFYRDGCFLQRGFRDGEAPSSAGEQHRSRRRSGRCRACVDPPHYQAGS